MLDPGKPAFVPKKGKPNVIMFVGLQGEFLPLKLNLRFYPVGLVVCSGSWNQVKLLWPGRV